MTQSIPFLIAIEGIDGAGKSTLAASLRSELSRVGYSVLLTKEPTNGTFGKQLRESATTGRLSAEKELELLMLDRAEHVRQEIQPALNAGSIVILDRYYYSSVAYQGARWLSTERILFENESCYPRPDCMLLLDIEPSIGLSRINSRGDKANHFETLENLARCREIFLSIDRPEIYKVDASRPFDEVLNASLVKLIRALSEKAHRIHGLSVEGVQSLMPLFS